MLNPSYSFCSTGRTPALLSSPAAPRCIPTPQILNPFYSFCNTLLASKGVLFEMMGKEGALEVMLKNPAVLQCGA